MIRSDSQFTFSQVPQVNIPRSVFNRSHGHKTTFDAGYLVPFFIDEVLPGDTFSVKASILARLATPIFPLMDNMELDIFYFFVPNRLLWENWQRFCGEQDNPDDSIDYTVPTLEAQEGGFGGNTIFDYMGLPIALATGAGVVNALPFRAYNLVWNEWFRDQNLQDSVVKNIDDGPDPITDYTLLRRGKRHDYFTSCLPWPQKGVGVTLPLGGTAPVTGNIGPDSGSPAPTFKIDANNVIAGLTHVAGKIEPEWAVGSATGMSPVEWSNPALQFENGVADLSAATAATINSLREAFQIQKLLERDARGGTRYVEILRSHFGVVSPDARLQRPEYLGGGSIPVIVNPVTQTSQTNTGAPLGKLAAMGVASGRGLGFSKSFVEHGYVLGLVSVRADLSYQQGLHRMWSRKTRYDFYWPAFANLGEQAVLNKEIYYANAADPVTGDDGVFGYQERWAEYRYYPSKITGLFRSQLQAPLDQWHLAEEFGATPELNAEFIESNPPVDRVIAVPSEPHFLFDSHISMRCARPMPTYSVPGMIDHF